MAVVNLQIVQPVNGAILEGSGAVSLHGAITSSGHPKLFPKWYSSLVAPPTTASREAAIPVPSGGDALNFAPAGGLPLGSQTIVLAAKDQAGESPAELQAGTERAWRHAYSMTSIARRLRHSPSSLPVALAANLGYRYYAHNLHKFYTCDWPIGAAPARPRVAAQPGAMS